MRPTRDEEEALRNYMAQQQEEPAAPPSVKSFGSSFMERQPKGQEEYFPSSMPSRNPTTDVVSPEPDQGSNRELLKSYFASKQPPAEPSEYDGIPTAKESADDLNRKRLIGGLGEAFDQIGYSIAGGNQKSDPSFYRNLTKQGEDDAKSALDNRKLVRDYMRQKYVDKKDSQKMSLEEKRQGESERHNRVMEGAAVANSGNHDPDRRLPTEAKQTVEKLAQKNANKLTIATQVESVMGDWEKMSDTEKLQQGRQLIKVLNSAEGQDAVSADEAKRLAGKLEYAFGNFSNSNPTQFGRDLEGFRQDAINTTKQLRHAVKSNQKIIKQVSGREQPNFDAPPAGAAPKTEDPEEQSRWRQSRIAELMAKKEAGGGTKRR